MTESRYFVRTDKLVDLLYRIFLWSFVAYLLSIFANSNCSTNNNLPERLWNIASSGSVSLISSLGFFLSGISIATKILAQNNYFEWFTKISNFIAKVSSDLILVTYNSISFICGLAVYSYRADSVAFNKANSVGIIFIFAFIFILC